MEENILKELVKSRKILKRKFESIKRGEAEAFNKLENTFKPITEPLNKLVKLSNTNSVKPTALKQDKSKIKYIEDNINIPKKNVVIDDSLPKPRDIEKEISEQDIEVDDQSFYSQSSDWEYNISDLSDSKKLDNVFGPHKVENGNWKLGNSDFEISGEKIKIGNKSWALTPGLYSLLFHQKPEQYDSSELEIYKRILIDTNAHRRNYDPSNQLKGNRGHKYKKIISKLFPSSTHIGKGLMKLNLNKSNYIYWDNPNEIVERLKLLLASQHAGNNNHTNEILSIIDELREANIIE